MMLWLRILLLGLALLLGQALLKELMGELPRPDLVLIFALSMGLRSGGTGGLLLAFLAGFAVDVLSGSPLGLYALLRGTACASARIFDRAIYVRSPLPWAIFVAAYTLLDGALLGLVQRVLTSESAILWTTLLFPLPVSGLMTAVLSVPLLSLLRRWDVDPQSEGGYASLASRARS